MESPEATAPRQWIGSTRTLSDDSQPTKPLIYYHHSRIPAALRLSDDIIYLIISFLSSSSDQQSLEKDCPIVRCEHSTSPRTSGDIKELKKLALVHKKFLPTVRTILFKSPTLDSYLPERRTILCTCFPAFTTLAPPLYPLAPLQALSAALLINPNLGTYIRHLPTLGDLTASLLHRCNVSPSLLSRLILDLVSNTPNLLTLDFPAVVLKCQESLIEAITKMKLLHKLILGRGCLESKDGTSLIHEGDLRRISKSSTSIDELVIKTPFLGCSNDEGWVEPFYFPELSSLSLIGATSLSDKHLLALVSRSNKLQNIEIDKSISIEKDSCGAEEEGELKKSSNTTIKPRSKLTTSGVSQVLQRHGSTLKTLSIDTSNSLSPIDPTSSSFTIPAIHSALSNCNSLVALSLIGPSLIHQSSIKNLGPTTPPSITSDPRRRVETLESTLETQPSSLSSVKTLTLGLEPNSYAFLSDFITSSSTSSTFPFSSLRTLNLTNPPSDCIGSSEESIQRVDALGELAKGSKLFVKFANDDKKYHGWARSTAFTRGLRAGFGPGAGHGPGLAGFPTRNQLPGVRMRTAQPLFFQGPPPFPQNQLPPPTHIIQQLPTPSNANPPLLIRSGRRIQIQILFSEGVVGCGGNDSIVQGSPPLPPARYMAAAAAMERASKQNGGARGNERGVYLPSTSPVTAERPDCIELERELVKVDAEEVEEVREEEEEQTDDDEDDDEDDEDCDMLLGEEFDDDDI